MAQITMVTRRKDLKGNISIAKATKKRTQQVSHFMCILNKKHSL